MADGERSGDDVVRGARHAPAAARNRGPLLTALRKWLPDPATVLEIASGSGEHAVFFAAAQPGWQWLPTEVDAEALDSIEAHRQLSACRNVAPARRLDVTAPWQVTGVDAIVSINLLHVSPWAAAVGLMRGASRTLAPGGWLLLYGPFRFGGAFEAASNEAFDRACRARNAEWGVRDAHDLDALGRPLGLHRREALEMPANNHVLAFERE